LESRSEVGTTSDNNYLHVLDSRHPLGFTLIDTPGHRDFFRNTLRGFLQVRRAV
jgi:translation elongation factor EF-1alpha